MNDFYTYAYLREDRTPYYIGKGTGNRIYDKRRTFKLPKDKSRIIFLKQNLTEEESFRHEIYMIAVFGRKDNGTGILRNLTDGGEGVSNPSEETRKKKAEITRKRQANKTPEQKREITRKRLASMTPEQRSEAGRKRSENMTPEQRSEIARKANASRTPEQRSEISRKANASRTPEQRSEMARKIYANRNMTPEQRSDLGRKANSIKFQCTETGFITNASSLLQYQRARGIDTSKRVRLDQ